MRPSTAWTTLTPSTKASQDSAVTPRMLVMTLRTDTCIAVCARCSACTTSSALLFCAANRWFSQPSSGVSNRVLVAQMLHELHGERRGQGALAIAVQGGLRDPTAGQELVEQAVGFGALVAHLDHSLGHAAQVLDQDQSERDGDGP